MVSGVGMQVPDAEQQESEVEEEEEKEERDGGAEGGDQEDGGEDEPALESRWLVDEFILVWRLKEAPNVGAAEELGEAEGDGRVIP